MCVHVHVCVCASVNRCTLSHSLQQRRLREAEAPVGDAVHEVEGDPGEAITVEEDEVVLEDQQRAVGDQDQALQVVVPVVHPWRRRRSTSQD